MNQIFDSNTGTCCPDDKKNLGRCLVCDPLNQIQDDNNPGTCCYKDPNSITDQCLCLRTDGLLDNPDTIGECCFDDRLNPGNCLSCQEPSFTPDVNDPGYCCVKDDTSDDSQCLTESCENYEIGAYWAYDNTVFCCTEDRFNPGQCLVCPFPFQIPDPDHPGFCCAEDEDDPGACLCKRDDLEIDTEPGSFDDCCSVSFTDATECDDE